MRWIFAFALLIFALIGAPAASDAQELGGAGVESIESSVCRLIESAAHGRGLPVAFLTRLIWQESAFRADAFSPAGAQGIAQFMPKTATERGLANPYDPEEAIPKATELLLDLKRRFGNLGLAAAAYNAGPARVDKWLAGLGGLPAETQNYVLSITAHPAEDFKPGAAPLIESALFPPASCAQTTLAMRRAAPKKLAAALVWSPWGVQLAGNFSKAVALAAYARARKSYASVIGKLEPMILGRRLLSRGSAKFYQVRAPAPSRGAADKLCEDIHRLGGACVVLRS